MRRIITSLPQKNEPSLLEELSKEYKEFKKLNPERHARLPASIKQKAKDVADGGVSTQDIATQLGLTRPNVHRWLEHSDAPAARNVRRKREQIEKGKAEKIPQAALPPKATPESMSTVSKAPENDWVKIRIDGHEVEVARKDFWELMRNRG